jgi:hypothetical protein
MKSDRFKLEEKIYRAWSTSDDLEDFVNQFYEGESRMTDDEVFNVLWGLKELHDIRCKQLFDIFKRTFQLDEYASDEIKELREQFLKTAEKEGVCDDGRN